MRVCCVYREDTQTVRMYVLVSWCVCVCERVRDMERQNHIESIGQHCALTLHFYF